MARLTLFQKIALGLGTVGGATYYWHFSDADKRVAHASWTTGYVPHCKWDNNWDHRSPEASVHPRKLKNATENETSDNNNNNNKKSNGLPAPTATRHLILIRHGQYNIDGKNDSDRYLTKLGKIQAEYTGNRLKTLGLPYTTIIKSTMTRAQETGTIITSCLPDIPVQDCHMLREGAPVPPEPPVGHWRPELQQFYRDGARIEAAFREYFYRADPQQEKESFTILVCHANVIRYFVCRALQFPAEGWLRLSLNHASITWISIAPSGRVVLRALGDCGHMPPDVITG